MLRMASGLDRRLLCGAGGRGVEAKGHRPWCRGTGRAGQPQDALACHTVPEKAQATNIYCVAVQCSSLKPASHPHT